MAGARSYPSGVPKDTCQRQYVVLLTDGLPTLTSTGSPGHPSAPWRQQLWGDGDVQPGRFAELDELSGHP